MTGAISPAGDWVFVRNSNPGSINVYGLMPSTGALATGGLLTLFVDEAPTFFGIEQIALHPKDEKLFITESNVVNVYKSLTEDFITSITDPNIVEPTGITVVAEVDPCALPPPAEAIVGTDGPDQINGTSGNDVIFGKGGNDQINGLGGNDLICGGTGSDLITGGAGDDVLDVKDGVSGNDSVNGGAGNDVCTGDPRDALSSCNP